MGYSIAWVAVQTTQHERLFELARVAPSDEPDELFESPTSGAELDTGWYLLVGRGCNHRLVEPSLLASLTDLGPVLTGSVEEHVMFSSAALWQDHAEVWFVKHDAQEGIFDLEATGRVPESFISLRDRMLRDQEAEGGSEAEVDLIFDIPLLLAKELCGFKHDEALPCRPGKIPVAFLDRAGRSGHDRPWWKFW